MQFALLVYRCVALASASRWPYRVVRRLLLLLRQMKRRPLSMCELLKDSTRLFWILLLSVVKFQPSNENNPPPLIDNVVST
jgi:hypothetical protein